MTNTGAYTYLDYAASTPLDPRVLDAMRPYFLDHFGNASSIHRLGQVAEAAISEAREVISALLGGEECQLIFTSGGTESDNLALRGIIDAWTSPGLPRILTTPVEHSAVLGTARHLADQGRCALDLLPVDRYGMVAPDDVRRAIRKDTALVSVIYANNEVGTINPIQEIGQICREMGIPFHTDAVQAAAHLPINIHDENIDLLSLGAHKFYGPKGVGALFVNHRLRLTAQISGGKQEMGMRAGSSPTPLIVGLAEALKISRLDLTSRNSNFAEMRGWLIDQVLQKVDRAVLTGHPVFRLPNHASFAFQQVDGSRLLMLLDARGFACSSGSACKVGTPAPSEVLTSMGFTKDWALGGLRVTVGKDTRDDDLERFAAVLPELINAARRSD